MTGFTLSAQTSPITFGIKGGLNLSSLTFNNNNIPTNRVKPGLNIGFTTTYNFSQNLFLQSGLSFTTKGAEIKGEAPIGFDERLVYPGREAILKSNQLYVQVPVYAGYRIDVLPGAKLVLTAGPYVAYGIGGKSRLTGDILYDDVIEYSTLEEKTFASRGLERFDIGLGTGIGVDFGKAIVGVTYELGLRNIGPSGNAYWPFYSNSYKNRNVALSLEYKF